MLNRGSSDAETGLRLVERAGGELSGGRARSRLSPLLSGGFLVNPGAPRPGRPASLSQRCSVKGETSLHERQQLSLSHELSGRIRAERSVPDAHTRVPGEAPTPSDATSPRSGPHTLAHTSIWKTGPSIHTPALRE